MKRLFDSMPQPASVALFLLFIAGAAVSASAQDLVVYDWESRTRRACPDEVNQRKSGYILIQNVNDILYEYKLSVTATQRNIDDWAEISGLTGRAQRAAATGSTAAAAGRPECQKMLRQANELLTQITTIIDDDPTLPRGYRKAGLKTSIRLSRTLATWDRLQDRFSALRDLAAKLSADCGSFSGVSTFLSEFREADDAMRELRERIQSKPHLIREPQTIRPNTDYTITVEETFEGNVTDGGNVAFQCNPASGQLTLTAGVLFSRIPDRGYEARKVPDVDDNVLVVEGNSDFRPEGVALLNYLLPRLDFETAGLALSAGPVIRFGSKSDLSTLGFFTGVSGHLYRRLYITPGFHFGEFADFPAGFKEGQAVPADFGTLTPVKRWTTRFALAISFRTASFSGLGGGDTASNGDGDGDDETVQKEKGKGGGKSGRAGDLTASARGAQADGAEWMPAGYSSNVPDEYPSFMRTASLRSTESKHGTLVTVAADSPLNDYTTFANGNVFYLIIPNAKGRIGQEVVRRGLLGSAKLEQSGSNLVISFVMPRGTAARVRQKFNRLEVSFTAEGAAPAGPSVLAARSQP